MVFQSGKWRFELIDCSKNENFLKFKVVGYEKKTITIGFDITAKNTTPYATYIQEKDFVIPMEILHAFLASIRQEYPNGVTKSIWKKEKESSHASFLSLFIFYSKNPL